MIKFAISRLSGLAVAIVLVVAPLSASASTDAFSGFREFGQTVRFLINSVKHVVGMPAVENNTAAGINSFGNSGFDERQGDGRQKPMATTTPVTPVDFKISTKSADKNNENSVTVDAGDKIAFSADIKNLPTEVWRNNKNPNWVIKGLLTSCKQNNDNSAMPRIECKVSTATTTASTSISLQILKGPKTYNSNVISVNVRRPVTPVQEATSSITISQKVYYSQNYSVNGNDTLSGVILGVFSVRAIGNDVNLKTVKFGTATNLTRPTTLYLYDGSILLSSVAASSSVVFDLGNSPAAFITKDTSRQLTVKADFPANTANGSTVQGYLTGYSFMGKGQQVGQGTDALNLSFAKQYIYRGGVAYISLSGRPSIVSANNSIVAMFPLLVTALGDDISMFSARDVSAVLVGANGSSLMSTSSRTAIVTIPNNPIANGSTAQVNVTVTWPLPLTFSGPLDAAITNIKWTAGTNVVNQEYGLNDFRTTSALPYVKP